ncbi:alpha/beta fold hydrolase [Denitrobaculum tricleocarpae]|uniref:Alpha/beta hydrolase n=1 Tax=Denitrobaculum tricleocarpae TaxID=2591009 RepID=A0A545TL10_9PROT|nr:alpha/beta hydrolase [Denitrobaculum tricleocarpae]TQV77912.1 alpha/beta hydrolase [Denitrobaculum tricleocarpae]
MTLFEDLDKRLLPGFKRQRVQTTEGEILALVGGEGPPLLMLHGDPQTHLCWHGIAPRLAEDYSVVLTDLRGRGESHKPGLSPGHLAYAKRTYAKEQLEVMEALGFDNFRLVGHDRGARVARRMALDHPERIERLAIMDIVPALDFYAHTTAQIAQDYYYFFFLTQPAPIPESLIRGDPEIFMGQILTGLPGQTAPYDPEAFKAYIAASTSEEAIVALCECFRAGLSQDIGHDRDDRAAGRTIACPTLVMWGDQGVVGKNFDIRSIWKAWAPDSRFEPMPCGHFIPEEEPDRALRALREFLV